MGNGRREPASRQISTGNHHEKSLIALALLTASGAALTQSPVTLSGRIDASVGSIKDTGSSSTDKKATTKMFSGNDGGLTSPRGACAGPKTWVAA